MPRRLGVLVALVGALALISSPVAASTASDTATSKPAAAKVKVKVKASKSSMVRGKRAKLKVTVKGGKGKVVVYQGKKKVKTLKLRKGKATYKTPKSLKRGTHKFRFVHVPSGKSKTAKLVVRSKSKLKVVVSARTFSREGEPATLTATVSADGKSVGGVFTVSEGSTVVAKAKARGGKASVPLPTKLAKGSHKFTVSFTPASKYVKAPGKKSVSVKVTSQVAFAGDGMYIVGVDVMPGLYVSRGNDYCYWKRMRDFSGTIEANDSGDGDRYIRIMPTDKVVETYSCEDFLPAPSTKTPVTSIPGDGQYRIGFDLAPGIYRSGDATDDYCYWKRLSDATGDFDDIIDNDSGPGRRIVQVEATDAFLETYSCGTWTKIG